MTYYARSQAFARKSQGKPVPPAAALEGLGVSLDTQRCGRRVSYTGFALGATRLCAAAGECSRFCFDSVGRHPTNGNDREQETERDESCGEHSNGETPQNYEPSFCTAVLRKWRSSAVADVLRARGSLQTGVTATQEMMAEFSACQHADANIGLRECAWPSCEKVERTVREFKQCSGCRSVWYCSPEHHTLDWGAHKKDCQKLDEARRAAMAAGGGEG